MSNTKTEFKQLNSLSTSILSNSNKKKNREYSPLNLIALLLLFVSLLFLVTLSIILYIQNSNISKLNSDYNAISLSSKNITAKINSLQRSHVHTIYLMNSIQYEVYQHRKKYEDYSIKLSELKRTNALLSKAKTKSKIITKEERNVISKMINETNPPILKMVYQASSTHRGDVAQVFHDYCKGTGPFVALVKIEKNIRIGAYSSVVLEEDHGSLSDHKAFLFNVDANEKYMVKDPDRAVSYNNLLFLNFGSSDLFLTDEFFTNRFSYSTFPKSFGNPEDLSQKNKLTKGMTLFNVLEFELLQVINPN